MYHRFEWYRLGQVPLPFLPQCTETVAPESLSHLQALQLRSDDWFIGEQFGIRTVGDIPRQQYFVLFLDVRIKEPVEVEAIGLFLPGNKV